MNRTWYGPWQLMILSSSHVYWRYHHVYSSGMYIMALLYHVCSFRLSADTPELRTVLQSALAHFQVPLLETAKVTTVISDVMLVSSTIPGCSWCACESYLHRGYSSYCWEFYMLERHRFAWIFWRYDDHDVAWYTEHMTEWMGLFRGLLELRTPNEVNSVMPVTYTLDSGESMTRLMQTKVCEAITLYISKYEEDFVGFIAGFIETTWSLLSSLGLGEETDKVWLVNIVIICLVGCCYYIILDICCT